MPQERASVFEVVHLGVESLAAPGVAVAATKKLQALGFQLKPKIESSRFRPAGYKYDTLVIPGKDWSEFKVSGKLDYDNLRYALSSVVNSPTITTVGTNGRNWSFISSSASPDVCQTFTIDSGSQVRAARVTNGIFTDVEIVFKRDEVEVSGTVIGQQMQDPVYLTGPAVYTLSITGTASAGTFTLTYMAQTTSAIPYNATAGAVQTALGNLSTVGQGNIQVTGGPFPATPLIVQFTGALSPGAQTLTGSGASLTGSTPALVLTPTQVGVAITEVTATPAIPGAVNVYVDSAYGSLGTTKLTRVLQANVKVTDRFKPLWVLNSSNLSFAAIVETNPQIHAKIKMQADSTGMAYLSTLRAGTTVFLRFESVGPALPAPDAAYNYKFWWDMAAKVESPDDLGDHDGGMAVDWTFRGVHDAGYGKVAQIQLVNLSTAL